MSEPVTKYMHTDPHLDLKKQELWFDNIFNDSSVQYFIVSSDEHDFAVAHLYDISKTHLHCFWGYYIGAQEYKERGMAKHIRGNIYDYVFLKLCMHKLCGEIFSFNKKVIDMALRWGFEQEGLLKQHIHKNGKYYGVVRVALMKDKWMQVRANYDYTKASFNLT